MPELPEVETTKRGIEPYTQSHIIESITVRNSKLRWPVEPHLNETFAGQRIDQLSRRAKYLIFECDHMQLIWHLGMSGNMRIVDRNAPINKHDHIDVQLRKGPKTHILRYHDPRRFGALLFNEDASKPHPLLETLGPEPLTDAFNGEYLYEKSRKSSKPIKTWIMDNANVVGVGNIYASESLFLAGIHPLKPANKLSRKYAFALSKEIKTILARAIKKGGTTLKDFVGGDGKPGYFQQSLLVYGRAGEPCTICAKPLTHRVIGQRATVYCVHCQK